MGAGPNWTQEENRILLENYPLLTPKEILPLLPRRSLRMIQQHIKYLRRRGAPIPFTWQQNLTRMPALVYTDVEKAWLACGLDCEGTIGMDHNHGITYSPYIFFGNSKKPIVDHFHKISHAPVSIFVMSFKETRHMLWADQWHIKVRLRPWLYSFLTEIKPFLIIKREQADLCLEFIETRNSREELHAAYTDREMEIYQRIRDLNERGASRKLRPLPA